jgi:phosphate starvation-inducible PhoH-like protein
MRKSRRPKTSLRESPYSLPEQAYHREPEPIRPKTANQDRYIKAIKTGKVIFGTGSAGSGKSFIAASMAADMIRNGEFSKLLIIRPAVGAQEDLGFIPGELEEKYAPYIFPIKEILYERLGKSQTDYMLKVGKIEGAPIAFLRGRTFKDCVVLVDEAQNITPGQMKLILTRIGENCKMIITGDSSQRDLTGKSGLNDAIEKIGWIPQVKVVTFTAADVVRSGICGDIVSSYE